MSFAVASGLSENVLYHTGDVRTWRIGWKNQRYPVTMTTSRRRRDASVE